MSKTNLEELTPLLEMGERLMEKYEEWEAALPGSGDVMMPGFREASLDLNILVRQAIRDDLKASMPVVDPIDQLINAIAYGDAPGFQVVIKGSTTDVIEMVQRVTKALPDREITFIHSSEGNAILH